jgi:uncharacterized membrane protein
MSRPLVPTAALLVALLLAGCATPPDGPGPEIAERSRGGARAVAPTAPLLPSSFFPGGAGRFVAWRCEPSQDLVTAHPEEELRLWSAHGGWRLAPAVVASGSRYQQGETSFWSKGEEAVVESPQGRLECRRGTTRDALTRRNRPGTMFHGRGNEPGWTVSLPSDAPELDLLLDHGARRLSLPYRVTRLDNDAGRVILESGRADRPFRLRLEAAACFDDMSGEPFPVRVSLEIDGETYRGCGQGIAPDPG